MNRLLPVPLALTFGYLVVGCATGPSGSAPAPGCAEAAAWIEECVGLEVGPDGCDEDTAAAALAMTCEELAEAEGKSDCTFWTPWDCWNFDGGGSSTGDDSDGESITVSVDECMSGFIDDCAGVSSLQCARVVLEGPSGEVVATEYTGLHGGARFDDLEGGVEYTVRVVRRDGETAEAIVGDYTHSVAPAARTATPGDSSHLRFSLRSGEREQVRSCASVEVRIEVVEPDGTPVDGGEITWDWIASYEDLNGAGLKRPHRYYEETVSSLSLSNLRPGTHEILFHRVSIPDASQCNWYYIGSELHFGGTSLWYGDECRLPNRDDLLLDNFAVSGVSPVSVTFTVSDADMGSEVVTDVFVWTDPVPGE